jgi:hypothetical protein
MRRGQALPSPRKKHPANPDEFRLETPGILLRETCHQGKPFLIKRIKEWKFFPLPFRFPFDSIHIFIISSSSIFDLMNPQIRPMLSIIPARKSLYDQL